MTNLYDPKLRTIAKAVAKNTGLGNVVREGVYVMVGGPSYETVAELKLLRLVGADAVGSYRNTDNIQKTVENLSTHLR